MGGSGPQPLLAVDPKVHQGFYGEAFVAAIAAAAGFDVDFPRVGHGKDFSISARGPKGTSRSRKIDVQVKSWSKPRNKDGVFKYPLEVTAYNYLSGQDHDVRQYLILCLVPANAGKYAHGRHTFLRLNRSAYWFSLRDQQPDYTLSDDSRKTIYVPQTNLLTVNTLTALLEGDETAAVVKE